MSNASGEQAISTIENNNLSLKMEKSDSIHDDFEKIKTDLFKGGIIRDSLDLRIKKLKRSLEGWREIILNAHSVLLWEKQWHPGVIFGALTSVFLLLWIFDPSVLTTISTIGLIITVGDYLVPTIAASIFRNDMWTGMKEKKFEEICRNIVYYYTQLSNLFASYYLMRSIRPKMYYSSSVGALLIFAWLGSSVNNLLLTYLFILMVLLLPGLEHQGLITKYCGCVLNRVRDVSKKMKVESKSD